MRILWVKANKLLPVHSGGDLRSYHIARQLVRQNELCFFSYYEGSPDFEYEHQLAEEFPGAVCACTGKVKSSSGRVADYFVRLPSGIPYAVSRFKSGVVQKQLRAWFQEKRFDVAVCDFLDAAVNFPADLTLPCVLFQHNVESEIWRRHSEMATNPARKLAYALEHKRMVAYEKRTVRRFHHVIAVSEHDRRLLSAGMDDSQVSVVPTGVDLEHYRPDSSGREPSPLLMFVGAMDWEPNIDAVEYFCKRIWPAVQAAVPGAHFRIVGRNPDRRVLSLAGGPVEVTGRVHSVADQLHEAAVVVVPLRIGGGTRLKIYEAMATGKAVVSTSVGAEGLDVHPGKDILLADTPETFCDSIVTLLRDRELRKSFERSAAQLAAVHGWQSVGEKFASVLRRIAGLGTAMSGQRLSAVGATSYGADLPARD